MKKKIVCIAFGKGGHQEQMQRLLSKLEVRWPESVELVIFTDSKGALNTNLSVNKTFIYHEARDKHSSLKTLFRLPFSLLKQTYDTCRTLYKYQVVGIVITGPGVAIVPAIICKIFSKKVISFESWSRFENASLTGRILCKFSDLFFIQNKSLKKVYKNYTFKGKL